MGRHSKPSRIRLPQAASTAAAGSTLAGVAAAICLTPQAPAAAATVPATRTATQSAARESAVPSAYQRHASPAELLAAVTTAKAQPGSGLPSWYTVRPGDTLSSIAARMYHNPAAWPVLYWRNHAQVRWANIITAGQRLRIPGEPARIPRAPKLLAPPPVHTVAQYTPRHARPQQPQQATPAPQPDPVQATTTAAGGYPGGAFGQCVVERESGGDPQVMNSTGHYGLYQFSYGTWVAAGGNPADFGHASVGEQEAVFERAYAMWGTSPWAPYDGC